MPLSAIFIPRHGEPQGIHNPALLLGIILVYIVLETVEFARFRYASGKTPLVVFFIIRLGLWLGLVIFYRVSEAVVLNVILTPLISYYAYFCLPKVVNLSFCGLLVFHEVFISFLVPTDFPDKLGGLSIGILFFVVKIVFIMFFQIYARLWERDRKIQAANASLMADLRNSHTQLKRYAERIADTVALEERNRIARDIHDSLGHSLAAINIQLSKAEAFFERDGRESRQALFAAKQAAVEAIEDVRQSLQALNRKDDIPLLAAIEKIVARIDRDAYDVTFSRTGAPEGVNYSVLMIAYRVIQEGVTNIYKHARARRIDIAMDFGPEEVTVRVKDDGAGFTAETAASMSPTVGIGFGLNSLRERLELVRGRLLVTSAPGKGAEILATAPRNPLALVEKKTDG
ncbi:MAG: sensor histidine kinase [Spirochaetales bacterium]|nr:sensor histidine kinase [Spirochaetales bacterium]